MHEITENEDGSVRVPDRLHNTEDFAVWLRKHAAGRTVDLGGRTLRPKGGYEKSTHGLEWHEHPHPHWYLPFMPANTTLRNGSIVANARIALICQGKNHMLEDVHFEGARQADCHL